MNRRSFIKNFVGSFLTVIGVSGGTFFYAREIEPALLNTHEENFYSKRIPDAFHNFKIVQFTDTHVGFQYTLKKLRKLVDLINTIKPDLIVFTGDLVDKPDQYDWPEDIVKILNSLKATHGKYWIYGNHDHGGGGTNIVKETMTESGFNLLNNSHSEIKIGNSKITLAGVDDMSLGRPNIDSALEGTLHGHFKILLSHAPDFADITRKYPVDLQLSGHSHGGQVRLPFIGHLYTPSYAVKYTKGLYTFKDERLNLYVSSGIGTTRLPFRFLCIPEVYVMTLKGNK